MPRAFSQKGDLELAVQGASERLAQLLRALDPAGIGRYHRDAGIVPEPRGEMRDKQVCRFEMVGTEPKRILECRQVMHVERDHAVGAYGLEKLGDVARRDRVARLGARVLARVGEVGNNRGHARGRGIAQGAEEKQQPYQLVVDTLAGVRMERLDDEDIAVAHADERTRFVLAVLELALLVRLQGEPEVSGHAFAEFARGVEREERNSFPISRHATSSICRRHAPRFGEANTAPCHPGPTRHSYVQAHWNSGRGWGWHGLWLKYATPRRWAAI